MTNPSKPTCAKVAVSERPELIDLNRSGKLAAMRAKAQQIETQACLLESKPATKFEEELRWAQKMIDDKIEAIKNSLPPGRQNKLFAIRHGSIEAIKALSIKTAFKTLGLACAPSRIRRVADLDYHGKRPSVE